MSDAEAVKIVDPLEGLPERAKAAAQQYERRMQQLAHPDLRISSAKIGQDGVLNVRLGVYFYSTLQAAETDDPRTLELQTQQHARELKQVMARGSDDVVEVGTVWRRKDGSVRWILVEKSPASPAAGIEASVVLEPLLARDGRMQLTVEELRRDWTRRA